MYGRNRMATQALADVAVVASPLTFRGTFEESQHGNVRLLTIKDLVSRNSFDAEKLTLVHADRPASRISISVNDILMPARGFNYPARIVLNLNETILPTGQIHIIRPQSIEPLYLLWYLNRKKTQERISMQLTGSTIQSLKKSDLQRLQIEVPPLKIQKIIGDVNVLNLRREGIRKELQDLENKKIELACELAIDKLGN